MTIAIIAYIIAQVADVVTTRNGLEAGGREANPVVAFLMSRLGRGWVVAKLAIAGGSVAYMHSAGAEAPIWVIAGITAAVAVNNVRVTR